MLLVKKGLQRTPDQTPLEFASGTGVTEAVMVTAAYNRVRFGAAELSAREAQQIEELLARFDKES
jgi:uncharacterized protein DUF4129